MVEAGSVVTEPLTPDSLVLVMCWSCHARGRYRLDTAVDASCSTCGERFARDGVLCLVAREPLSSPVRARPSVRDALDAVDLALGGGRAYLTEREAADD